MIGETTLIIVFSHVIATPLLGEQTAASGISPRRRQFKMLKTEANFASRIRKGCDSTVIFYVPAIEADVFNSRRHGSLGQGFSDRLGGSNVAAVLDSTTQILVLRTGGNQRDAIFVVDQLTRYMTMTANDAHSWRLLVTTHFVAHMPTAAQALFSNEFLFVHHAPRNDWPNQWGRTADVV
jgi:hypothetical protein